MLKKLSFFSIILIMALGVALRSYKLGEPLGDWHSWRQADTASVAREYVKAGKIDLLAPKYHDLSSIPSGLDNPEGHRFVEFPLRDAIHAQLVMWFPGFGLVFWGRVVSIIFSALTIGILYLIVNKITGTRAALLVSFVYATLPFNVYYGRVILPEPMLVFFMILALYSFMRFWDKPKLVWYLVTLISLTIAILTKPTALVILLPIIGYSLSSKAPKLKFVLSSLLIPALAIIPYFLWRRYLTSYPEGIPANNWLFNGNGIRFKGAWFRWLFGERIGKMILGYYGLIPLGFGLFKLGLARKETLVYGGLVLGALSYLVVIATGNVQHDYYQIQIMPAIAILVGVGADYLLNLRPKFFAKLIAACTLIGIYLLSLALSWYELKGFFWVNNRAMVEAGQALDQIAPYDAKVIAPYMGDTAFLFQTNRRGWADGGGIEAKIEKGASYYVTTTKDAEYQELITKYNLVKETDNYAIIRLR